MYYILIGALCLSIGILLGSKLFVSKEGIEERKQKYWETQKQSIDFKISSLEIEYQKLLQEKQNEFNRQLIEYNNQLNNLSVKEAVERSRVERVAAELEGIIKQKQIEIQTLDSERDRIIAMGKEYEQNLTLTKLRMLKNAKYEREKELQELQQTYDQLVVETTVAISLIQAKMKDWSNAERIAYEERMSREEVALKNRLSVSSLSIEELRELYAACGKMKLANPVPLYKAIYDIYFKGPVKELGVKLSATGVCGIYKITNTTNDKVYIGQSVDIAERWKQHIKRGTKAEVGTLTGASLYEAMFTDGVWNFSFQILEECEKDKLNEREKFWIGHYQSNEIGYNKKL